MYLCYNCFFMWSLFIKEINSFFSTITGYLVIIVFLLLTGLFLWVFPGDMNILESGYANLDPLFYIAPWVFLFLAPAITMRLFSDEKKMGTLELLLTKPLTELQIVVAKYFAALTLVLFSLLPALVYFISVYKLGNPAGNLDIGGIWGSFIGLFLLAGVYTAIGLFASSITDNQLIAFIVGTALSFILYMGFDLISSLGIFGTIEEKILALGINEHYKSLSRGVVSLNDTTYFICTVYFFIILTRTSLQSRKW